MPQINRRHLLVTAATAAAIPALGAQGAVTASLGVVPTDDDLAPRVRQRFDTRWRFAFGHLDDEEKDFGYGKDLRTYAKQGPDSTPIAAFDYDDSSWRLLNLPHDWAVELPFVDSHFQPPATVDPAKPWDAWDPAANHGFKPLGRNYPETSVGWYRKTLKLDAADAGKRISLEFDGVFRAAIVMINGYIVKSNDSGYTPFRVELNDFLNTDDKPNTILVRVDASLGEGWFYEGAGIYRHVWLVKTDPVHVPQYGVLVRSKTDGTTQVTTTLRNDSDDTQAATLTSTFTAPDGKSFNAKDITVTLQPWQEIELFQPVTIANPMLWSLETPQQYVLTTTLSVNGAVVDKVVTLFGLRDIRFDPNEGLFVNDKPVKIKGTCNHQDHAGVGSALPDALQVYRLQCLKDMGCNAYRTSHNPPTPELLDACDRMGVLVLDETRMMTSSDEGLAQLKTMILRDRNRPSVMLWSIGNEEPQQGTDRGAHVAKTMKRLVNQLDPTRLVTAAMDSGYGEGITSVLDVIGFNYRDGKIDQFHADFPGLPIVGTETASTVSTRGEYSENTDTHVVPAYDTTAPWWANTAEVWWPHFDARSFIAGGFIWTGFDYRGEPTPYSNWPSISSQFGVMDTCGFPKDNYYYYRAWWRPEPLLHLFPHWNWEGQEGKPVSVWAHSNCDEVELFVNGRSVGKKAMTKDMHVEWSVPYAPGKIEAFAYTNGVVVLKDKRMTAGVAAKVVLTADRLALKGDGMDCAVLRAEVFDAYGRTVPKAANLVQFTVTGPAAVIGVGNGNPNSHEADKASQRMAFNGLCCAIVQTTGAGAITVTASSDGLTAGRVILKAS